MLDAFAAPGQRACRPPRIGIAIEECVDFIVIAGDLSDGDWLDFNTGLYMSHVIF